MAALRAGTLDTVVLFESLTVGVDGMGDTTETWATITGAPTWAQYMPIRGAERIEADKLTDGAQFKLRVRRHTSLKANVRVTVDSEVCKVLSVEDNKRADDMVLWCRVDR